MQKLSVVIPVFNEARTIREIVARVRAIPYPKELVLVDDCSTDGTPRCPEGAGELVRRASSSATSATRVRARRCGPASP